MRKSLMRGIVVACLFALVILTGAGAQESGRDPTNSQDFFGMVGRDPWYEYGTNPDLHPNQLNQQFLENMVAEMADMGVGWIRIEMRAETDEETGPGRIDWAKHDWFINELAPRYGIKVLALLGSGLLGDEDETYEFQYINDDPDSSGRNHYTRTYVDRVEQVVTRYQGNIAAYEILNEPNANQILEWETAGRVKEVEPLIYGRLAIDIYETIQAVDASARVVAGSLLYDVDDGELMHLDWMDRVYRSRHIRDYVSAHGHHPWHGVSIHPYFLSAGRVVEHMHTLRDFQLAHGDESPLWITEIGRPGSPPGWTSDGIMPPTASEVEQAEFLYEIYTRLEAETPFVARVFWFKYEDFGVGTYASWGLVRLRDANFTYGPDADPWPRKYAFGVYQSLARPDRVPTHPRPRPDDEGERVRYFPETGQTLRDPFLAHWEAYGGLAMFGFPITTVFDVQGRPVQYFERARFEYWPEHVGTHWEVQLGLLGRFVTRDRTFERQPSPDEVAAENDDDNDENGASDRIYFPETGQYMGGAFRGYWENNGGLEIFGFPISPEFEEVNPADGNTYVVQYFERARFEWHPELAGTEYEVQLGLLGSQVIAEPGWRR